MRIRIGRLVFVGLMMLSSGFVGCATTTDSGRAESVPAVPKRPAINSGDWTAATAKSPEVTFSGDGEFRVTKPSDPQFQRNVVRLLARKSLESSSSTTYSVLIASTQQSQSPQWSYEITKRPMFTGAIPATDPDENSVSLTGEGAVVVSGTSPIVVVKRATVASEGTTFAVEAISGYEWRLKVLKTNNGHEVKVRLENSSNVTSYSVNKCIQFTRGISGNWVEKDITATEDDSKLTSYSEFLLRVTGTPKQ